MAEPFLSEIRIMSASASRRRAGRSATASCCRSTRTRRCSRCSARPTAATGGSTSRCPTCRAGCRSTWAAATRWASAAASRRTRSRSPRCRRTRTRSGPRARRRRPRARRLTARTCWRDPGAASTTSASNLDGDRRRARSRTSAAARRTEHAAVPGAELLHRPAGHLPVARPEESAPWHNPMSVRSGCSPATSRPPGWMFCEGQLLPISENETLFNLIGTTYGGDGQTTFALPDLRGRVPMHHGQRLHARAETGGVETITLTRAPDPGPQPPDAGRLDARGPRSDPTGNVAGAAARRRSTRTARATRPSTLDRAVGDARSAAASRTTTSSRTSASTSSSRCSASSRRQT